MKGSIVAAAGLAVLLASALAGAQDPKGTPKASAELKDFQAKVNYTLGLGMSKQLKALPLELNADLIAQGLRDGLADKPAMTDEQIQQVQLEFRKLLIAKQNELIEQQKKEGEKAKKEGEAFLAENKKKPGIKTLPSGVQYQVQKEGTGKSPRTTDIVTANYEGRLINGKVFDSSQMHGGPADFPLNQVIRGWTEALPLMKVGSKWTLFIPSELAYGAQPPPRSEIRPNDPLIFDIELLGIKPPSATPTVP